MPRRRHSMTSPMPSYATASARCCRMCSESAIATGLTRCLETNSVGAPDWGHHEETRMKSRYFLALCMLCVALLIDAAGSARAQPAPGNITAVTLLDVLSNANVPQNVETSSALLTKLASDTQ